MLDWEPWASEPFFPSYATVETAQAAYKNTLSDVGCTLPFFDYHDQRMVSETLSRTATTKGVRSKKAGIIDTEEDEGCEGFDLDKLGITIATHPTDWDTDQDGIPDWFEAVIGTNPSVANNNDDRDGDYYTDLEEYLNWMAAPHFRITANEELAIDLKPYFAGYKTFDIVDDGMRTYDGFDWTFDGTTLKVQAQFGGIIHPLSVTVKDPSSNISMTRLFNFAVESSSAGIVNLKADPIGTGKAPIYNLQGRRVQQPTQKGIYIQNGKKMIVQ